MYRCLHGPADLVCLYMWDSLTLYDYVLWVVICCPIQMLVRNAENADGPLVKTA